MNALTEGQAKLAEKVQRGDAVVGGTIRNQMGTRFLVVTDHEAAMVCHIQLPWKAEEEEAVLAAFGVTE